MICDVSKNAHFYFFITLRKIDQLTNYNIFWYTNILKKLNTGKL